MCAHVIWLPLIGKDGEMNSAVLSIWDKRIFCGNLKCFEFIHFVWETFTADSGTWHKAIWVWDCPSSCVSHKPQQLWLAYISWSWFWEANFHCHFCVMNSGSDLYKWFPEFCFTEISDITWLRDWLHQPAGMYHLMHHWHWNWKRHINSRPKLWATWRRIQIIRQQFQLVKVLLLGMKDVIQC